MGTLADKSQELTQIVTTVENAEQVRNDLRSQLAAAEQAHTDARGLLEVAYTELTTLIDAGREHPVVAGVPDGGVAEVEVPATPAVEETVPAEDLQPA